MAVKKAESEIEIPRLQMGSIKVRIIGRTPMFQNRMSSKAKQTLLIGGRKKTAADKAQLKHDPIAEYRDSMEMFSPKLLGRKLHEAGAADQDVPTMLGLRVVAFKAALCTAALETVGITKTSAQRLLFIPGDLVPLYGTPHLRMDIVRSADIARTPDVRSRAFLPRWGAEIEVQHVMPQLPPHSVVTLACNAGMLVGIGDFRQEKGKGAFGSFRVLIEGQADDEWDDLVANHAATAQRKAIDEPELADADTRDLMEHFCGEQKRRAA